MALNLEVSKTKGIAVVRCRGRIVFGEEADELRRVVLGLLKETNRIVLDFAWIEFIDSSGLAKGCCKTPRSDPLLTRLAGPVTCQI